VPGPWQSQVDFDNLEIVKTTFIKRDYRSIEADILLTAPLLDARGRRHKTLIIYILIEHQSAPDRMMPLRILDYVVQTFNYEVRNWRKDDPPRGKRYLHPVLPIVLYTGTETWHSPGVLTDLIHSGEQFKAVSPRLTPLYLNLPGTPESQLTELGGYFGYLLRVFKRRRSSARQFAEAVEQLVRHLESLPEEQRDVWFDLLSYVHALIYYERRPSEHQRLIDTIQASIENDQRQREVTGMAHTIAEKLIEEGREVGREEGREVGREEGREEGKLQSLQRVLAVQLRAKFGDEAEKVAPIIQRTADTAKLEEWLLRVVTAGSLDKIGIRD
jgi:hypothetical protein